MKGNPCFFQAKLHQQEMEKSNALAASMFLNAQCHTCDKDTTLDLHNLYVPEALQALEIFLGEKLEKLNRENKKSIVIFIITGRGARSNNGLSKIKPAVCRKLASNNIK